MGSKMWCLRERLPTKSSSRKGGFLGKVPVGSRLQKEEILGPNGSDLAMNAVRGTSCACHTGPQKKLLSVLPALQFSATALELFPGHARPHTRGDSMGGRRAQHLQGERGPGSSGGLAALLSAQSSGNYPLLRVAVSVKGASVSNASPDWERVPGGEHLGRPVFRLCWTRRKCG